MARTGRFGRLPTQAPDLSSQIVSMMEQWMNAEDNNILDAWENGGKYKGKKVTDRMILAHYRKRRNSYEKDDPEWDQWNQDLFQIRFRIANEKVMMRYAQGGIGPAAVAAHYREWARKMPRNSSYYRSLMATAGDYAKAAHSASQQGGSAFDYNAMMRRHNAIQRDIDRGEAVIGALDIVAQNKGLIPEGATLTDPGVLSSFEARELDLWLASGSPEDEDWKVIIDSVQKEFPGFQGNVTYDRLQRMIDVVIDGKKRQIRNLKGAPFDTSSQVNGLRGDIRGLQNYRDVIEAGGGLDAATAAANAFDVWYGTEDSRVPVSAKQRGEQTGFINSTDPKDLLDGNGVFRHNLRRYYKDLTRDGRDQDAAHAVAMQHMLDGDVDWLRNYEGASNIFGGQFSTADQLMAFATVIANMKNGQELADNGDAVLVFDPDPATAEDRLLDPTGDTSLPFYWKSLKVNPQTGRAAVDDESQKVVPYQQADGSWTQALVQGEPVVDEQGTNLGYVWDLFGFTMYGWKDSEGVLHYDDVNPWNDDIGEVLSPVRGGGYTVTYDGERLQAAIEGGADQMVSNADITTDTEVMEDYIAKVQDAGDIPEETKATIIQGVENLTEAGFWDDKTSILTDQQALGDYMAAFPGDFEAIERNGWAGTEYESRVRTAIARESLRRRFDLADKVPVTDEDMVFLTPEGGIMANQYGFDEQSRLQNAEANRQQRETLVSENSTNGESYGQAMRKMTPTVGPSSNAFLDDAFIRGEVASTGSDSAAAVSPYSAVAEGSADVLTRLASEGRYKEAIGLLSDQLRQGTGSDDIIVEWLKSDPNIAQKMNSDGMQRVYTSISMNSTDDAMATRSVEALGQMRAFSDFETPAADVLNSGGDFDAVRAGAEWSLDRLFKVNREASAAEFRDVTSEGIAGAGWDIDRSQPVAQRTDLFRAYAEMRNIPGVDPLDITKPIADPFATTAPRAADVVPWQATTKPPVERKDPAIKVSSTLAGLTNIGPIAVNGQPIKVANVGVGPIGVGTIGTGTVSSPSVAKPTYGPWQQKPTLDITKPWGS